MNNCHFLFHRHACIRYQVKGEGFPLVLLHGFLEHLGIWESFSDHLSTHFKVISIDIMGHGWTRAARKIFTVEFSASLINDLLSYLHIDRCLMAGHSMGGYSLLAMEELYPEKVAGMCMFHSIPWGDTAERKQQRDQLIHLIREGKRSLLVQQHLSSSFAPENMTRFAAEVERAKNIAMESDSTELISAIEGMKIRKDRTFVVESTHKPILWMIGEKDAYISKEKLLEVAQKTKNGKIVLLPHSGHMGFIEEKEKSAESFMWLYRQVLQG